jgi:hypothetical protein
MANILPTSSIVAKTALPILKNMLSFSQNVNRDYESEFGSNTGRGYAPGQTINIKKPPRYLYRAGRVAVPQDTVETTIPLTLSQGGVDIAFSSLEKTVGMTQSSLEDKIAAALAPVANEIDRQGLALAHYSVFNTLNPTGVVPNTQALALQAATDMGALLDEMAAPRKDRRRTLIMNPKMNGAMVQGFAGLFNSSVPLSKQYQDGVMVDSLGFMVAVDQNVDVHTNGAGAASTVNGANQTGSTITVTATTAGTITRGTTFTIAGVFSVNPQSRVSTGRLQNFVVTADVASGSTSLPISPAIVTTGAFQNVTNSPAAAAAITLNGSASTNYSTNIAYHRDAFTLAMVPLDVPSGMGAKAHSTSDEGFHMRVLDYYDGKNDEVNTRIDVLYGWAATYPELAVRYHMI